MQIKALILGSGLLFLSAAIGQTNPIGPPSHSLQKSSQTKAPARLDNAVARRAGLFYTNTVPVPKVDVVKPKSALWVTRKNLPVALGFAANDPVWDFDCRECRANGYVVADAIKLEPVSTQTVSGLYFIHNDHLGTPKLLTDSSGTVVWQQHTTPLGEITDTLDTGIENLKSFPGQYRDSETGYSYNYFRDYDPTLGRYIQSDPIGLQGGLNTYGYVGGNPVRFVDPLGLELIWFGGVVQWDDNLQNGQSFETYPNGGFYKINNSFGALTRMNWGVEADCACDSNGQFSLQNIIVDFSILVSRRRHYINASTVLPQVNAAEQQHVDDLAAFEDRVKSRLTILEQKLHTRSFSSIEECEQSTKRAVLAILEKDGNKAVLDSKAKWDDSGKHTIQY